jgi:hypothetical protein
MLDPAGPAQCWPLLCKMCHRESCFPCPGSSASVHVRITRQTFSQRMPRLSTGQLALRVCKDKRQAQDNPLFWDRVSLCSPGWPRTQDPPACLTLSAGITGMGHKDNHSSSLEILQMAPSADYPSAMDKVIQLCNTVTNRWKEGDVFMWIRGRDGHHHWQVKKVTQQ